MKGLTSVILIAISVGLFVYFIRPQYEQVQALQVSKDQYDKAISVAGELREVRNNLVNKYNSFSTADLRRISKFLPEQIDDVRLILDINGIAQDNNIDIDSISLGNSEASSTSRRAEATSLAEQNQASVDTLNMSFSFDATYEQFLDFVEDLQTSLRIMDITDLSFSSVEGGNTYTFSITLQTYWLK